MAAEQPDADALVERLVERALEAANHEGRRLHRKLLWQLPLVVMSGVALGVGAAAFGVSRRPLELLVDAFFIAAIAFLGCFAGMGGALPAWEANDEPAPWRRGILGGLVGLALGVAVVLAF